MRRLLLSVLVVVISVATTTLNILPSAHADARETHFEGDFRQGGLVFGRTEAGATVKVDGKVTPVGDDGFFLVGFGRDAAERVRFDVQYKDGKDEAVVFEVKKRKYNIQRIDGVKQKHVTPPKEALERIRKESRMLRKARARNENRRDFLAGFTWPVVGRISGVYGSQRIYNGTPLRPHFGIDIAAPTGTPVKAPAPGIVSLVHDDMYYSGGTLLLDHGMGLSSTFIHLSKVIVEVGQRVETGDVIAEVGSTGRSTGPHLDWRINLFATRLDAELLVPPMPE